MIYLLLSFTIITDTLTDKASIWCIQDRRVDVINFTINFDSGLKSREDIGYVELMKIILMKKFPEFEMMNYGGRFIVSFTLQSKDMKNLTKILKGLFSESVTNKEYKFALRAFVRRKQYHHYSLEDILIQTAFSKSYYGVSPYDFTAENFDKDVFFRVFDNVIKHSYLTIIVSGDVNPCNAINEIKHIFKKRKVIKKISYPVYVQKGERIVLLNKEKQNVLYLGFHIPFPDDKDFYILYVFSKLFPEGNFIPDPPFLIFKYPIPDTSNWENTLKLVLSRFKTEKEAIEKIDFPRLKKKAIADFYIKNTPFPCFKAFFLHYNITPEDWIHNIKIIEPQDVIGPVEKYLNDENLTIIAGEE